jgi:uncharacterized protein
MAMNSIYAICYRRGPAWVTGKSVFDQPLQPHLAYMKGLRQQGRLLLAGPFVDDEGGLVVVRAADIEAARQVADDDPAIHSGVMTASVHPWKVLAGEALLSASAAPA